MNKTVSVMLMKKMAKAVVNVFGRMYRCRQEATGCCFKRKLVIIQQNIKLREWALDAKIKLHSQGVI